MYTTYCMHGSMAAGLFDDHKPHFGSLESRLFSSEDLGPKGIERLFMGYDGDA